jgi:hypothetical protein
MGHVPSANWSSIRPNKTKIKTKTKAKQSNRGRPSRKKEIEKKTLKEQVFHLPLAKLLFFARRKSMASPPENIAHLRYNQSR